MKLKATVDGDAYSLYSSTMLVDAKKAIIGFRQFKTILIIVLLPTPLDWMLGLFGKWWLSDETAPFQKIVCAFLCWFYQSLSFKSFFFKKPVSALSLYDDFNSIIQMDVSDVTSLLPFMRSLFKFNKVHKSRNMEDADVYAINVNYIQ